MLKKIKESDKLKSVEVNVVIKFIKAEVESSIIDDEEQDMVIGFKQKMCNQYLAVCNGVLWCPTNPVKKVVFFLL